MTRIGEDHGGRPLYLYVTKHGREIYYRHMKNGHWQRLVWVAEGEMGWRPVECDAAEKQLSGMAEVFEPERVRGRRKTQAERPPAEEVKAA